MTNRRPMARRTTSGPGLPRGPLGAVLLGTLVALAVVGSLLAAVIGGQASGTASLDLATGAGASGNAPDATPTGSPSDSRPSSSSSSGSTPAPKASPSTTSSPPVPVASGPFAGYLMIADRQNGRILMVDTAGTIHWQFPTAHGLPAGQGFSADDAFLSPDGKTITANEEGHQVVVRIDIATRRIGSRSVAHTR